MNKKEAWEIVTNELQPIFLERGYERKWSKWSGFVKQNKEGFEHFFLHFNNYFTEQEPTYYLIRRFNIVEKIYLALVEVFDLNVPNQKDTIGTFVFSYGSLNFKSNVYLKPSETEAGMKDNAYKIQEFMLETGFPMLEKYNTLQAIDAEINGDDFWPTDWQHKFTLGGGFNYKRLIIAKLCNNSKFQELYDFHINELEEIRKKYTNPRPLPTVEGKTAYQYLVEVLLKDVEPIAGI